jgi:hypothetical protein
MKCDLDVLGVVRYVTEKLAGREMAQFAFALRQRAAALHEVAGWQPGDEFEAARKKRQRWR